MLNYHYTALGFVVKRWGLASRLENHARTLCSETSSDRLECARGGSARFIHSEVSFYYFDQSFLKTDSEISEVAATILRSADRGYIGVSINPFWRMYGRQFCPNARKNTMKPHSKRFGNMEVLALR